MIDNKKSHQELLRSLNKQAFEIKVEVKEGGFMPAKAHPTDAGYDLRAVEDITIYPGQVKKVPLNIRLELPISTWAEIASKSGLGAKGLLVYAGVIDESYRGVPHVVMSNINLISHVDEEGFPIMRTEPIVIKRGEKLAQLIMSPYTSQYYMTQVDEVDEHTDRGTGGFGSSGV